MTFQLAQTFMHHLNIGFFVKFSNKNNILALRRDDHTLQLWNVLNQKLVATLATKDCDVHCLSFSKNDKLLLAYCTDSTARLWDVETEKLLKKIKLPTDDYWTHAIDLSPGNKMFTYGLDKTTTQIHLKSFETGNLIRKFTAHTNHILIVSFSPDGRLLGSGSADQTAKVWCVETGKSIKTFVHDNWVYCVAFSMNGETFASASKCNVQLWNFKTGCLLTLCPMGNSMIDSIALTPNGKIIASAVRDGTVSVWNAKNGDLIKVLDKSTVNASFVASTSDGTALVLCSPNGIVQQWHFWPLVQPLFQKYALLLSKCRNMSSTTIYLIFKLILQQQDNPIAINFCKTARYIDVCKKSFLSF